ncbi:MAG TPA: ribonuclease HI [Dehalococcoidia bacterium]|nr:ribonuclease HI [Dehalococcoidia bacterium]
MRSVQIFSDGACLGNPGPGGYGVILVHKEARKELSGGARLTTNNRMELLGVIKGFEALKERCSVRVVTDSQYVVDSMEKGWARKWRANAWLKSDRQPALNADLWSRLLDLCAKHVVSFEWVRGHAGHPENERCDRLAVTAARLPDLPRDDGYEAGPARSRLSV